MVREKGKNKLGPGLPEERNFETARNMTELSELHRFSPMNYETCCLGGGGGLLCSIAVRYHKNFSD